MGIQEFDVFKLYAGIRFYDDFGLSKSDFNSHDANIIFWKVQSLVLLPFSHKCHGISSNYKVLLLLLQAFFCIIVLVTFNTTKVALYSFFWRARIRYEWWVRVF